MLTGEGRDRATVYGQNSAEYPDRFRMLRAGSWKYVSDAHGDERLFDLANDGQELSDVKAANPEMANMLRQRLRDGPWRARRNDPQAIARARARREGSGGSSDAGVSELTF